jgi:hypothetical protein
MALLGDQGPPSLLGKVTDQKNKLDELSKTVARGVPALRDAGNNLLALDPSSAVPLLSAPEHDVALKFKDASNNTGILAIVDKTGENPRTLETGTINPRGNGIINAGAVGSSSVNNTGNIVTRSIQSGAGGISSSANIDTTGLIVRAGGISILSNGGLSANTIDAVGLRMGAGGISCPNAQIDTYGLIVRNTITCNNNMSVIGMSVGGGGVSCGGTVDTVRLIAGGQGISCYGDINCRTISASWNVIAGLGVYGPNIVYSSAGLKTGQRPLVDLIGESPLDLIERVGRSVHVYKYDAEVAPEIADGVERVGFNLDELPRSLVIPPTPIPVEGGVDSPGHESYNATTMLATTMAALAELRAENAALAARVAALEAV